MKQDHHIPELSAAIKAKCPRCRRGDLFNTPMYGFRVQKMNVNCPHCGLKFEREPGYFYVSMFVSYALVVAELVIAGLLTYLVTKNLESPWLYIGVTLFVALLLSPFNYRYSRVVLLYWLTPGLRYLPDLSKDRAK